jgi:plastocyanin
MIFHAIALVLDVVLFWSLFTDAQRVLVVSVGREGKDLSLKFSPEEVFANVGDQIQFQFYPLVSQLSLFIYLFLFKILS